MFVDGINLNQEPLFFVHVIENVGRSDVGHRGKIKGKYRDIRI